MVSRLVPDDVRSLTNSLPRYPPEAILISVPPELMTEFFEMRRRNPDEADSYLVNHFAGTACVHAKDCRRWIIVHGRDMPEWTEKEKHLAVYTPEKYFKMFGVNGAKG